MTKIPLRALHFCETTNSGQNGNMFFLVLQDDGLLEGPSLILIRLLQITVLFVLFFELVLSCLASNRIILRVPRQLKSCIHVFVIRSFLLLASSEAPLHLYHPQLPRTCFPATKYKRRSIFSSKGTFGPNSSPSRDKFIYRKWTETANEVTCRSLIVFCASEIFGASPRF